ncbi:MAG: cytochrome C [candidate division Zixibacteria bacterium RBG_16_53_22]|nr:MAG: cytochrome C [candidate division Zixibacteria bacterium RBG_16_53_22]
MAQIFPVWTNKIPVYIAAGTIILVLAIVGFFWYYGSPWYTDVGYRPAQPVRYSHKLHAGDLGIDCRYCHYDVEVSAVANIPPTQICMNCHKTIGTDNERLLPVRESWSSGVPIQWVRVHQLPDFAYFDHSAHLRAGVGCVSCHGNVANMEIVELKKPLSMGWCLDCHRNPDTQLRPRNEITNMNWTPPADQVQFARKVRSENNIAPPEDCSGCHR